MLDVISNMSDVILNLSDVMPNGSDVMPNGSDVTPNGSDVMPNVSDVMPNGSDVTHRFGEVRGPPPLDLEFVNTLYPKLYAPVSINIGHIGQQSLGISSKCPAS